VAGGADLQVVLTNDISSGNDQIIAGPGIRTVADLKGKKVAAEQGTVDHYLLLLGLKKARISEKDITFVPLETGAAAGPACCCWMNPLGLSICRSANPCRSFSTTSGAAPASPCC
jgi:NitT/TauT family transport system substrate-binding protein